MDCSKVRRDVARLIYFFLGKHGFFFWHFTVKKTRLTMHGAWLFYLYIKLCACMDAMCKEGLTKKKVFAREAMCWETLMLILSQKIPTKTLHQLSINYENMLLLTVM